MDCGTDNKYKGGFTITDCAGDPLSGTPGGVGEDIGGILGKKPVPAIPEIREDLLP